MRTSFVQHLPAGALALVLALGACDRPATDATLAPERSFAASPDAADASSNSGAILIRGQTSVLFFNFDAERGLLSAHVPSNVCSGGSLNVADIKIVTTPSEIRQRLVQIADDDSQVAVYRASSFADAGLTGTGLGGADIPKLCTFLAGPNLIAEGIVQHRQNLSNASFAAHWGGWITGVDGSEVKLTETFQLRADAHEPNDPAGWVVDVAKVLLSSRG